jgi:hypothetical protein
MGTRASPSSSQPTEQIASFDVAAGQEQPTAPTEPRAAGTVRIQDRRARRREDSGSARVVLGRYRLHRRLGAGGFGTVWHARDERLDRDVAVKLLPRERVVGGRFEREARAAARLSHPAIVTLYEAAVDDDGAYLVSELVRGATLGELLGAGTLSDREIVQIGVALCDALAHAHAEGVVHRDIKPSNVLVPERRATPAQAAKLTDFGVARIIGADTLTRTGDVIGTVAYMAPEQADGLEAGAPADLYSLALVIYEALTGINPVGTAAAARRARRLGAYLPALRRQRRDLPRGLGWAIDLALRPRPRERGSVEELRAALDASVGEVHDRRGVVASPWPSRTLDSRPVERPAEPAGGEAGRPAEPEVDSDPRPAIPWPDRALAAAVAAGLAAWLAGTVLAPSALQPAIAAVLAAIAVAALPGIGWVTLIAAAGAGLAAQGRPGGALVVVLAGLIPVLALPRRPARWPLGWLAPALGTIGLAGAWPALAARAGSAWQRAALGAVGWILLVAAETLGGGALYFRLPHAVAARSAWMPSLDHSLHHVLAPLASTGVLAPALVWALAAVLLPWITLARSLPVQLVLVTTWTAATTSATTTVLHAAHAGAAVKPEAAIVGAVAAGLVALAPALARAASSWRGAGNTRGRLA